MECYIGLFSCTQVCAIYEGHQLDVLVVYVEVTPGGCQYFLAYIQVLILIIPIQLKTTIVVSFQINSDFVVLFQGVNQMISISLCVVLDAKVIHTQAKKSLSGLVFPHSNWMWNWVVSMVSQIFFELFMGKYGRLF